jgi:hypothetical protein
MASAATNAAKAKSRPVSTSEGRTAVAKLFTGGAFEYPNFADYDETINDQVAHLNLDRGTNAKPTLDGQVLTVIKSKLDVCLKLFQSHLSTDALKHWKTRSTKNYVVIDKSQDTACTAIYESFTSSNNASQVIDTIYWTYNPHLKRRFLDE